MMSANKQGAESESPARPGAAANDSMRRSAGARRLLVGAAAVAIAVVVIGIITITQRSAKPDSPASGEALAGAAFVPLTGGGGWTELDNPERDGWDTEVLSADAQAQLGQLATCLADPESTGDEQLAALFADGFSCGALVPAERATVFEDAVLRVERAVPATAQPRYRGLSGSRAAFRELAAPFRMSPDLRVKFKLFKIDASGGAPVTRQFLTASGAAAGGGSAEMHATWTIDWELPPEPGGGGAGMMRIAGIRVDEFELVSAPQGKPMFSDCTASVLSGNGCYQSQILRGYNHWLERSQDLQFLYLLGNPGIAVGDINGDSREDLYFCQEAGLPNRLFVQREDGTAEDVAAAAGVDWLENSRCALLVDLDNDGDQDLAVAVDGGVALAANDGAGKFELRTVLESSADVISLSAADCDRDGMLDLYAGVYHPDPAAEREEEGAAAALPAASGATVYHDANNGGANSLFHNRTESPDAWRFVDVTRESGLDVNNRRFTLAAAWEDIDNDGDQDLYVANDFGRNNLYLNASEPGGAIRFADAAAAAGVEDSASGMGLTWGDYDRDGWIDLYVSNMFSAAGNRIMFQQQFKPGAAGEVKSRLQRFARGNSLFRNLGTPAAPAFLDTSVESAVTMGRWAWSSNFVDINNDGWDDLIVANGYITTEDSGDL